MFNIGFSELVVICIVLIVVVGPERLPSMMKTIGKTIRSVRQASRDIRASTGIDELLREDFDLYAPLPQRRQPLVPEQPPLSRGEIVEALPAPAEAPVLPANSETQPEASAVATAPMVSVDTPAEAPQPTAAEPELAATPAPQPTAASAGAPQAPPRPPASEEREERKDSTLTGIPRPPDADA